MAVIVLAGMIAAGKSTVSARLADKLNTDLMIEPVDVIIQSYLYIIITKKNTHFCFKYTF